ncbi:N6-adenosine-methyltransferase subunit mettl14 [Nowakowskiella sp. JEL0078]|nr:N6-adenosine-methyltransferase subunit mettl14 [Nowakowskiella sp. JEL0078]
MADTNSRSFLAPRTSRNQAREPRHSTPNILRNDYSVPFFRQRRRQHNFIREVNLLDRFKDYPKQKRLALLKDNALQSAYSPPFYLNCDLKTFDLSKLGNLFDVILIDPPLPESLRSNCCPPRSQNEIWSWEDIQNLKIDEIAAFPSFVFLWIGNEEGLEMGRQLLAKWKFRRCEDIVWIKTNKTWSGEEKLGEGSVLLQNKEHCLMGIKGTVRRSSDGHFIHCNVDTDVIIAEEPMFGSLEKPEELYHIIEHFCLGRRRLELFGEDHNIRPGWLTLGQKITSSNFTPEAYNSQFTPESGGQLVQSTPEIETLRPRTPPPKIRR